MSIKSLQQLALGLGLLASCTPATDSIEVTAANELGVTAIAVDHFTEGDARVFELRGFDAAGEQRALVRLRTGAIADAAAWFPVGDDGDLTGSEITTSIGDVNARYVTRETALFDLEASDPTSQQFLALDAVASTLQREANIVVPPLPTGNEAPYVQGPCRSFDLLTSPVAGQCCYAFAAPPSLIGGGTEFYNAATNKIVRRKINKYGYGCRASDGQSACAGVNCYYGPLGYARATFTDPPTSYWRVSTVYEPDRCSLQTSTTPLAPIFGDMTGSYSPGLGCPGGNDGRYSWDY